MAQQLEANELAAIFRLSSANHPINNPRRAHRLAGSAFSVSGNKKGHAQLESVSVLASIGGLGSPLFAESLPVKRLVYGISKGNGVAS